MLDIQKKLHVEHVVKKSKYVEEPFHSEYRLGLWHAWDKQTPQEQWNSLICSQKGYILMANIKRAPMSSFVVQLRHALDLSQADLARILCTSAPAVHVMEQYESTRAILADGLDRYGMFIAFKCMLQHACADRSGKELCELKAYLHGAKTGILESIPRQSGLFDDDILTCLRFGTLTSIFMARECDAVLRANNKHTICEIIAMVMNIGVCPLTRLTLTTPISDEYILAALRSRNTTHPTKED